MTIGRSYERFVADLTLIYESAEARNIADWVFEHYTSFKRGALRMNKNKELTETEKDKIDQSLVRLLDNEPVQYILQEVWFYKNKFYVDNSVLIPRPETEELVEWVSMSAHNNCRILDIGTGSGCIAIALKINLPGTEIDAIDVSREALNVATKNATDLIAKVNFRQLDFLNEVNQETLGMYDIVVSNPPYIPLAEKKNMNKNVSDHEPNVALFVADNDPFIFYHSIALFCNTHLKLGGRVYVEVHESRAAEVGNLFIEKGLKEVIIKKDMYGRERMVSAMK